MGLDSILRGHIRIMHTPEREAELVEAVKGIFEAGERACKHSRQFRGLLVILCRLRLRRCTRYFSKPESFACGIQESDL